MCSVATDLLNTPSPSFEDQLDRLEEISGLLENDTIPLADLLNLYEEGMQLAERCRLFLVSAEQRVSELRVGDGVELGANDIELENELAELDEDFSKDINLGG